MASTRQRGQSETGRPIPWADTREWIDRARELGELREVSGANWESEIGAITELLDHSTGSPCVLFDNIPGYPAGRRVIVNCNGTPRRQAVTLNLPPAEGTHEGLFRFWRGALAEFTPIDPVEVADGPVFENVVEGEAVDLTAFPVPTWHPKDGGRYIGTASLNILKDPDSEWVNVGTYRNQLFDKDQLGIFISPGKHGRLIREKYWDRGERCPIVVVVGADPLLFMAGSAPIPFGVGEFAWAGSVRGAPIGLVRGRHTGIPFPATAEIAIEGWIDRDDIRPEGPYGEFHGYYGQGDGYAPVIHVAAVYHRDDPILQGCPQGKPPHEDNRFLAYLRASTIERELRAAGVPRISGVWCPPETAERMLVVIGVEQSYPGHATQALTVGSQVGAAAYMNRVVVVVDPDVDVTSISDVLWAILTRADPERDISIVRRAWSGPLDSAIHPDERGMNSRLLIDATKPWEWRDRFAMPTSTPERTTAIHDKWGWILDPKDGRHG